MIDDRDNNNNNKSNNRGYSLGKLVCAGESTIPQI
jgi:hypothetical protein